MADKKIIQSRLGEREVDLTKTISFPKGLVGFEDAREFALLQIKEGAPFLILQSLDDPRLGLLVADPYSFVTDYSIRVGDAEQKLLQAESPTDLAVLVTVSIPPGRPEQTALNLTGPILVNYAMRLGVQVPQSDDQGKVFVHEVTGMANQASPAESSGCNGNSKHDSGASVSKKTAKPPSGKEMGSPKSSAVNTKVRKKQTS